LLEVESADILPRRWLICGGEAFSFELLDRIRTLNAGCRILNHYGPTETTIGTCDGEVGADAVWPTASVPIGRPLPNSSAYIVDTLGEPTPPGVAGELLIGGAGVARGYLNRPTETDERFVENPFSDVPGAWVYRTGDRARALADGSIEFLGRVDEQVKIRGFRVEPGEVEAALQRHPAVRQAAVVAHGPAGDQRLVAFVVASPQPSAEELGSFLGEWLPEYMLPSILPIDVLPLSPSGKVDRRALPDPTTVEFSPEHEYVAPRNELEREIAEIWQGLLGIDRVGVTDDFFALGGHSLLATQMITRIRRRHGNVPLRALFVAPTIGALAQAVADETQA
jgi:acyl-coenzyme A synthetase/AMP-(fatty) acid ligase/aryl carrier-like protein